jgi:hypothetical protein
MSRATLAALAAVTLATSGGPALAGDKVAPELTRALIVEWSFANCPDLTDLARLHGHAIGEGDVVFYPFRKGEARRRPERRPRPDFELVKGFYLHPLVS